MPSSPGHNRPLVPRVERLARAIRAAVVEVQPRVHLPFEDLYRPTRAGVGFTLPDDDLPRRSAWALLGEWLVAASVQAPCLGNGLAASHDWFWQGSGKEVGTAPGIDVDLEVGDPVELRALLPYLLDPMPAATRRDVLTAQSTALERRSRKASGVYYTPGDVANLMVERLLSHESSADGGLWLDPAHGSGVFLRAAFCALGGQSEMADRLYGVDLDPIAAETASFVLTAEDLVRNPDAGPPWRRWHRFRRNLVTGDALLIDTAGAPAQPMLDLHPSVRVTDGHPLGRFEPWRLSEVFPETGGEGFARVVANPPYAPLQGDTAKSHVPNLHAATGRASADISPVFVELAANILSGDGAMAVVLPLSVVSSTRAPFPELRQRLAADRGALEFLSFDRVPDALFGDDIKTRNAIVYMDRSAPSDLRTSPLYRWTSLTREAALPGIPVVSIAGLDGVPGAIPKIGFEWERDLLAACEANGRFMDQWHVHRRQVPLERASRCGTHEQSSAIALAPTAYNFLSLMREPLRAVTDGHNSQNGFSIIQFSSERDASAAYALLSSRLAFWLWHITGDGFHVTNALLRRLPTPRGDEGRTNRLADLGDRLWKAALENPVVSSNRGRTTVSYPTWPYAELLDQIDVEMGAYLGVSYGSRLAAWHEQLVVVDPDSERRNLIRRKR